MRSEQEVLQRLILDTVALLCRNTLTYQNSLQVQGLIGVTMDSNVFIIHFNEKFDGVTGKETSESQTSSGQVLGVEEFEAESNLTETHATLPVAQPTIRKMGVQTRLSQEASRECRQRRNVVQPTPEDASHDIFACDPVKEEISRVPVFPQPWPGFQNEPAESSTIPEGRSRIQLTPKTEINFMESETASSENQSKSFVSRSQNSSDVLEGSQYMGGGGNSSFQSDFSPITEFVGFQEPSRKPQRKRRKSSCDLRDFNNKAPPGSAPYIITKALHICAYPSCGKQFHHRHHLLRHQTMKHNRAPTKRRHAAFLHSSGPDLPLESSGDGLEQSLAAYKTFGADQSSSW